MLEKTAERMKNIRPSTDVIGLVEFLLLHVQKKETLFRTLFVSGQDEEFQIEFIRFSIEIIRDRLPEYGDSIAENYVLTFLMYGCVHIIREWVESNYNLSARNLAKLIYNLCDSVTI